MILYVDKPPREERKASTFHLTAISCVWLDLGWLHKARCLSGYSADLSSRFVDRKSAEYYCSSEVDEIHNVDKEKCV